jgi:cytochrome c oxidase subunit 6a
MFPQRAMIRTSQRFASQVRSPAIRTPFQRRFASTEGSAFTGAEDNAFNRERKAVKDHAVATSGSYPLSCLWKEGNADLTGDRSLAQAFHLVRNPEGKCGIEGERLTLNSVTIPALIIASINAYNLWNEHWAHWEHLEPLEERPEYPYQNLRTKNFFWGDGDKVSLPVIPCALNQS